MTVGHDTEDTSVSTTPEALSRRNAYDQALREEVALEEGLENELLDLYFRYEQPWYQVVDEQLFRQHRASGGRLFSELLLSCILAVASRYTDRKEVRSNPDDPTTAGRIFLEKAEVLLHFDLKWPSITTIQSLAILGIVYVVGV